jgi:hypothetical protein
VAPEDLVGYSNEDLENLRQCQNVERIPDQMQDFLKRIGNSSSKIEYLLGMNFFSYEEAKSAFLQDKYNPATMNKFPIDDAFVFSYAPAGYIAFLLVSSESSLVYEYEFTSNTLHSNGESFFDFIDSYMESHGPQ